MVYLDINKTNFKTKDTDLIKELDRYLGIKHNKCFILFYMEGCGPCNATRPEWTKIKNVLNKNLVKKNNIVVASIDYKLADGLDNLTSKPSGFPTMRYITNSGKTVENYEDSNISNKNRTIDSFVEWIKSKCVKHKHTYKNKTRKPRGRKWSSKYKRSINCRKPKGFSQRQYCKYSRKNNLI